MPDYDVAIVGAGPAGAATALRLARAGTRVLLLERSHFERPRVGESLAPEVTPLLRELGVEPPATQPSYGVRSHWGGTGSSSTLTNPHGTGWYVDRAAFDRRLAESAAAAGAELRLDTACRGVAGATSWTLTLSAGATTTARALVDATGRAARLGRHLGADRLAFDRLVAVTAFVPATDPGGFGLVETVPAGWCYSAPAGGGHLVAMLLTDADLGRTGSLTAPEEWRAALGPHTTARLGDVPIPELRTISAASQRLHRPPPTGTAAPGPTWLAVGDAALAQDPITGTGVVRALRSAKTAADVLLGTDPHRFAAYETALDQECTTYLHRRLAFYAAETRWPEAPFWQRRLRTLSARRTSA
ncbi:FAD-dependent oxidoreductase [Cryptosporangium japonicum]|uniref:Tryptophan 7-halogenase n=1 Tax=Cryptosporangium japonicum TaxID=80872 RepID=A0ABN0V097_9ACTN